MQLIMLYASAPAASTVHGRTVENIISMLKPCANRHRELQQGHLNSCICCFSLNYVEIGYLLWTAKTIFYLFFHVLGGCMQVQSGDYVY